MLLFNDLLSALYVVKHKMKEKKGYIQHKRKIFDGMMNALIYIYDEFLFYLIGSENLLKVVT